MQGQKQPIYPGSRKSPDFQCDERVNDLEQSDVSVDTSPGEKMPRCNTAYLLLVAYISRRIIPIQYPETRGYAVRRHHVFR